MNDNQSVYDVLLNVAITILKHSIRLAILFVRMTLYYIVKLIYKVFRLREIDVAKERAILNDQSALTTFKHEFVFDKSDEFITSWLYLQEMVAQLDLEDGEKAELIQYILQLISEAEREAFNTTYNYMLTKDFRQPSFEDMIIQGIFKDNKEIEPKDKITNPYRDKLSDTLRHNRKFKRGDI